jgi:Tol biopolymer transport system component
MNADGSDQIRLTNNSANDYTSAWSPDGTEIAFSSDRDGDFEIYVMKKTRSTHRAEVSLPEAQVRVGLLLNPVAQ